MEQVCRRRAMYFSPETTAAQHSDFEGVLEERDMYEQRIDGTGEREKDDGPRVVDACELVLIPRRRGFRGECLYRSRRCVKERALKRNGQAHNLCEEHRSKQNQHQRRFDSKKHHRTGRHRSFQDLNYSADTIYPIGSLPTILSPSPQRTKRLRLTGPTEMYDGHTVQKPNLPRLQTVIDKSIAIFGHSSKLYSPRLPTMSHCMLQVCKEEAGRKIQHASEGYHRQAPYDPQNDVQMIHRPSHSNVQGTSKLSIIISDEDLASFNPTSDFSCGTPNIWRSPPHRSAVIPSLSSLYSS